MLNYLRKKILAHRQKRVFREYGFNLLNLSFEEEGDVQYAQWQHPYIGQKIITQAEVNFFKQFVRKGHFAIDIGANSGDTTVPMALAVGAQGLVLALEPNPYVFKILEANARLNSDKCKIVALNCAATADEGQFTFGSGDASFGNGGIVGFTTNIAKNTRYTFSVKGRNLEKLLLENYQEWLPKLSLLKLDTEGYDKEILKSIPSLLSTYHPTIIAECFRQLNQKERQELYDVLADHGYDIFQLNIFDSTRPVKINRNEMMKRKHFDILATYK